MTVDDVWINNVPPPGSFYWDQVREVARKLGSDGCTCVADIYTDSCFEHDIHWRLGATIHGVSITTRQANTRFRKVIQSRSAMGRFSPVSWVRWLGVTIGARFIARKSV